VPRYLSRTGAQSDSSNRIVVQCFDLETLTVSYRDCTRAWAIYDVSRVNSEDPTNQDLSLQYTLLMVRHYTVGVSIYERELNIDFFRLSCIHSVQHWQKLHQPTGMESAVGTRGPGLCAH
jgi:hypothetical protein